MTNTNHVTFPSADGKATLEGSWYLPTRRATNGALIVMHGANNNRQWGVLPTVCEGAAALGLTALSFDFRFHHSGRGPEDASQEIDDLLGAYHFLQSFGKEIKPKRYYLAGKSLGAYTALLATREGGPLAGEINGVAVLGIALHDQDYTEFRDTAFLEKLTCPALFVIGERDPLGKPSEFQALLEKVKVPTRLEIIEKAGHSYDYVPLEGETPLSPEEMEAKRAANLQRVADITLEWLEQQDSIRQDLRK